MQSANPKDLEQAVQSFKKRRSSFYHGQVHGYLNSVNGLFEITLD
jgi:hypothetical protein